MSSIKESALDLIRRLPEECTWDDVMYQMYVRQKIEAGLDDLDDGRTVAHDDIFEGVRRMTRIVWSRQSQEDLRAIHSYIAYSSPVYAKRVIQRIQETVEKLSMFPESAARVPEWDRDDLREAFVHSCRIIFRTRDKLIEVVTIVHGARDLLRIEADRP